MVANHKLSGVAGDCLVFDPQKLRTMGAVAILPGPDGLRFTSVRDVTGDRLWTSWK